MWSIILRFISSGTFSSKLRLPASYDRWEYASFCHDSGNTGVCMPESTWHPAFRPRWFSQSYRVSPIYVPREWFPHGQVIIRFAQFQVFEENLVQLIIVILTCMHKDLLRILIQKGITLDNLIILVVFRLPILLLFVCFHAYLFFCSRPRIIGVRIVGSNPIHQTRYQFI